VWGRGGGGGGGEGVVAPNTIAKPELSSVGVFTPFAAGKCGDKERARAAQSRNRPYGQQRPHVPREETVAPQEHSLIDKKEKKDFGSANLGLRLLYAGSQMGDSGGPARIVVIWSFLEESTVSAPARGG
jgi:hypothetical protein